MQLNKCTHVVTAGLSQWEGNHQEGETFHPGTMRSNDIWACFYCFTHFKKKTKKLTILTCICLSKSICPLNIAESRVKETNIKECFLLEEICFFKDTNSLHSF